jgi:hypothetical protein
LISLLFWQARVPLLHQEISMRYAIAIVLFFMSYPAFADPSDPEENSINIIAMAKGCGADDAQVRKAAEYVGAFIRNSGRYDPNKFTDAVILDFINEKAAGFGEVAKRNGGKLFDKPCSMPRQLLDYFVESKGAPLTGSADTKQEAPKDKAADTEMSAAEVRKQLDTIASNLPTGMLKSLAGCWKSSLKGWTANLCLTNGADKVTLELRSDSGVTCRFDDGNARKRSDAAFVYAYSTSAKCTDGRQIEHFEGMCESVKEPLSCFLSVFRLKNNFFYSGKGNKAEEMNGRVNFVRTN